MFYNQWQRIVLIIPVWPSKSKTGPPYNVIFFVRNEGKYVGVKLYIPFKNTGQVKKKSFHHYTEKAEIILWRDSDRGVARGRDARGKKHKWRPFPVSEYLKDW